MKRALLFLSLLFFGVPVFAALPMLTYQVAITSITTNIISVSSSTIVGAVQVDSPTLSGRVALEIMNNDATANLWCVPTSSASLTSNTGLGRKITPGTAWEISISSILTPLPTGTAGTTVGVTSSFWCISDTTNATSKAAVTQAY